MNLFYGTSAICCGGCLLFSGCKPSATTPAKSVAPAEISRKVSESDLITVKLTPEAERRLGIETAQVKKEKTNRVREYAGELLLPLGRSAAASTNGSQSVFSLLPTITPADLVRIAALQVEADGQISAAEVQLEGARVALNRANELIASKAGAGKGVDEARLQLQLAETSLRTAQSRRALLGSPLFDAVKTNLLWVRVAVYVGDVAKLNHQAPALLYDLGKKSSSPGLQINPVPVPFSTAAGVTATDLYYELSGAEGYRPGQKFAVAIPLEEQGESLVVPTSAVLYDIHGDAWTYVKTQPHTFARHRIEVVYTANGRAVLARGPKEGVEVVTTGGAELFGTEFGPGK
jgi:multidrug efflux pump subunit AcrA (membrane-fusion protein)